MKKEEEMGNPIFGIPELHTYSGFGTTIYGDTVWYVIFGIPIIPLGRYVVEEVGYNKYKFYGELKLHTWQLIWKYSVFIIAFLIVVYGIISLILISNK